MFYRVFGGNGCGKTTFLFEKLRECVKNKRKAFLVVPEQCAVEAEKQTIRTLSGKSNLYVEVINFKRLCNRVFRELGGLTSVHLDDGARKMLMLNTLAEVSPMLKEYKNGAELDNFCSKALGTYNKLGTFKVSPSQLEKAAEEIAKLPSGKDLASKLYDIALIAEGYGTKLEKACGENSDIYEKLCAKLREEPFFCGCDVFFDSFYGFTAQEFEIIKLIAEQADNTYVTFACRKDEKDRMFNRSIDSAVKCRKIAEECGCEVCDINLSENLRHKNAVSLGAFEKSFRSEKLGGFAAFPKSDDSLLPVLCRDIHGEVRYAASRVHELVRNGASYRDIAICARNTDSYMGIIDTAFQKAGIPIGIDLPYSFSMSALYELILSALEGACDFVCEDVIRYIKTGLSGLDEEEADTLETYLRVWNIRPSHFKRDEDFAMNPDGYTDAQPDEYTLKVVNSARSKVFVCLDAFRRNLHDCNTVKQYSTAVFNLLRDIKNISGHEEIYDGADGEALELLCDMLDSFVTFGGDENTTRERFTALFKSCADSYEYARIPSKSDEVRFADVTLMRFSGIKHVIVLGANSGIFPKGASDTGLISHSDLKMLKETGIELGDDENDEIFDELFLAFTAFCSAAESCRVVYSEKNLSGEALYPSVIVSSVERITANKSVIFDDRDTAIAFAGDEYLFDELASLPSGTKKNTLIKYFSSKPEYARRLDSLISTFTQKDRLDAETLRMIYGGTIITSYSRLEKFRGCPFAHFCTYTLKLKPEPVASLGASQAGTVMHSVLEHLVPMLCKRDDAGEYPSDDKIRQMILQLLTDYLGSISNSDTQGLPKRFVYLYNRLSRLLEALAFNIVRELKVSKFEPRDFELNISPGGDISPVPIDIGNGCTLYIAGQIDRVDVYEKDGQSFVRVIDYKTGKKTFKMKDIQKGFNLQMLLYLEALRQRGSERYKGAVIPAGVLYSNVVSSLQTLSLGQDIKQAAETLTSPVSSGVFLDDKDVLFAMDSTEERIYLPVTEKNSAETLRSLEEMGQLLDFACATAANLAKEIRLGLKAATPFDGASEGIDIDPCSYCDMKAICDFHR